MTSIRRHRERRVVLAATARSSGSPLLVRRRLRGVLARLGAVLRGSTVDLAPSIFHSKEKGRDDTDEGAFGRSFLGRYARRSVAFRTSWEISTTSMAKDPLHLLLEHLRAEKGAEIPTSSLGRLRRTAFAGARVGIGSLAAKLRGKDFNLGSLSPEALAGLVESLGELKGIAMKVGQILSYVDGSLDPEARELLAVLQRYSQPTPFAQIERTIQEDLGERARTLLARLEREPGCRCLNRPGSPSGPRGRTACGREGAPSGHRHRHPCRLQSSRDREGHGTHLRSRPRRRGDRRGGAGTFSGGMRLRAGGAPPGAFCRAVRGP